MEDDFQIPSDGPEEYRVINTNDLRRIHEQFGMFCKNAIVNSQSGLALQMQTGLVLIT